jgi:hypothetical protein
MQDCKSGVNLKPLTITEGHNYDGRRSSEIVLSDPKKLSSTATENPQKANHPQKAHKNPTKTQTLPKAPVNPSTIPSHEPSRPTKPKNPDPTSSSTPKTSKNAQKAVNKSQNLAISKEPIPTEPTPKPLNNSPTNISSQHPSPNESSQPKSTLDETKKKICTEDQKAPLQTEEQKVNQAIPDSEAFERDNKELLETNGVIFQETQQKISELDREITAIKQEI